MSISDFFCSREGLFVVIEGIDGSGTTTQGDRLTARLQRQHKVFFTNEPSSGPAGMLIRLALARRLTGPTQALHDTTEQSSQENPALDPFTMAFLFAADRADHIATKIKPNLARGKIVICDRYILSTLAYQGIELPLDWIIELNKFFPVPDVTFYIDIPVDHARLRMRSARWAKDLYEDEVSLQQVRHRYLDLIDLKLPCVGPIYKVDGALRASEITSRLMQHIDGCLKEKGFVVKQDRLDLFGDE